MDEWDSVVMAEERAYSSGEAEAQEDADSHEVVLEARKDGLRAGFHKGCLLGFELGFYSSIAADPEGRTKKLVADLQQKVARFPRSNSAADARDVDFDASVQGLRATYRAAGAPLGKFPPAPSNGTSSAATTEW